jgi:hypothetical protein
VEPRVSVVVPTRQRPALVVRAVESALAQTLRALEVVVAVDGPDAATRAALGCVADARLRVAVLPRRCGIGGARNAGVRAARGRWVAFLDDDDEWSPEKLALQLEVAEASPAAHPIVACRLAVRGDGGVADRTWPRRLPAPGEPLSEYLFARRTPFWGEALIQTSTILVPRELAASVPFDERLAKHEDLDWLLRAAAVPGAALLFVPSPAPLATWHAEEGRARASTVPDWRGSLAWIRGARSLVTRRAYAAFCLTWIAADAARERSLEAFWRLAWEACRRGRPGALDGLLYLGIWTVPRRTRARLGRGRPTRA